MFQALNPTFTQPALQRASLPQVPSTQRFAAPCDTVCFGTTQEDISAAANKAFAQYIDTLDVDTTTKLDIPVLIDKNPSMKGLTDISPISRLENLQTLNCPELGLTQLDLSDLPKLENLDASYNQLTALNVYYNPELTHLYTFGNQLETLAVSNKCNIPQFFNDTYIKITTIP